MTAEQLVQSLLDGTIQKPSIEQILVVYETEFRRLLRITDKLGVRRNEVIDWITDYIVWSEAEDFIDR